MTINKKETKKRVTKTLSYSHITTEAGEYVGGGVLNSSDHIESEVWIDAKDHPLLNPDTEEWLSSGEIQLHLGGTRRAMEELGTILIALARYDTPDTKYSLQFDLTDVQEKSSLHLVLHLPVDDISNKNGFTKIYNFAKLRLSKDGNPLNNADNSESS